MKSLSPILLGLALCGPAWAGDDSPAPLPRRVAYVGKPGGDRARQFAAFLKEHFAQVDVADRDRLDPATLADADVVILDWSQSDAHADGQLKFPYPSRGLKSPLGPREAWTRPTVLIGSAGHLLAACWQVHGGSG